MDFLYTPAFKKDRQRILNAYVDSYYDGKEAEHHKELQRVKKEWASLEKYFFKEVDRIFDGFAWLKGDYCGYGSIWTSFPRIINEKVFAFPIYRTQEMANLKTSAIIAHEMLHFMEYEYLQKKFHLQPSEMNSRDNTFWQFTENLNVLIENSPSWRPFRQGVPSQPYPQCKALYAKMKRIWDKDQNLDNLIQKIFLKK